MSHSFPLLRLASSLHTLRRRPPRQFENVCRFSAYPPRLFPRSNLDIPTPRTPPQRSIQGTANEVQASQIPEDIGLLEDTFIMPYGSKRPSIMFSPRARLSLEWRRLKYHTLNIVGVLVYRFYPPKHQRPRLRLRQTGTTAATLHRELYKAFADNEPSMFRPLLTSPLNNIFNARLANRPRSQTCRWTLHSYTKRIKTVSDRAARLPIEGAAIRQAVVRIWAKQSLERWDARGKLVPGSDKVREVKEWVVLQRRQIQGKESPWVIWGILGEGQIDDRGYIKQR